MRLIRGLAGLVAVASSVGVVWLVTSAAAFGPNAGDPTSAADDGLPFELWLLAIAGALAVGAVVFRLVLLVAGVRAEPRRDESRSSPE